MKQIRILHTADLHLDGDPVKAKKATDSLEQIVSYLRSNKVNAIVIAGDVFERKQSYAEVSGVPLAHKYLRMMSELVDFIFIVKGNNAHDEPGSISLLHQLEPNIYAYEQPVCLGVLDKEWAGDTGAEPVWDILRHDKNDYDPDYIISLVPYPTKASLLQDAGIDDNNEQFLEVFENIFRAIGTVSAPYDVPKVLAFHGNVVGSKLSTGQTLISQDIMVSPHTLQLANANYYALGHIHVPQEVVPMMHYSGSLYNKNWGEMERKSFNVIGFDEVGLSYINIEPLTAARRMMHVDAKFEEGDFHFDAERLINTEWWEGQKRESDEPNPEWRFRYTVRENERVLVTEEKLAELREMFGNDVKIEENVIPAERESRSEEIMECKDLYSEVAEFAKVVNEEGMLSESLKDKVMKIQEVGE